MSQSLEPRSRIWGIRLVAAWSLLLALVTLANLLLFSASIEVYGQQGEVWWVFSLNILFTVGFGLSAFGLWQRSSWGAFAFSDDREPVVPSLTSWLCWPRVLFLFPAAAMKPRI